ncbi:hypothetical protein B0T21DRAFT_296190, partial [Apiosordaria backusii]
IITMRRTRYLAGLAIMASLVQPALASFWTVTELFVYEPTPMPYGCDEAGITKVQCTTAYDYPFRVKHTSTPTGVDPVEITTRSDPSWDLEISSIYLPAGAVPRSDLINYEDPTTTTSPATTISLRPIWAVDVTFTAPASCPTPFEFTTFANLGSYHDSVPSAVSPFLLPKATVEEATSTYTRTVVTPLREPRTTVTETLPGTHTTFHLQPTDLPPVLRPDISDSGLVWVDWYYVQNCYRPGEENPKKKAEMCPYTYGGKCSKVEPWVINVAAVFPSVFLLGFVENFFWFRRMMLGKGCLRFGTVCWALLFIFVIGFTIIERKRNAEDQARLREQWKTIPFGMRMRLWFRWGFRHKYPVAWLGARKTVGEEESIEMGIDGGGGASAGAGQRGQDGEDDMPLPAYPGPPSSRVSDTHSANSGNTGVVSRPVLGNPNAVLGSTGSGTVVIRPIRTPVQSQSPASTQRPDTDQRTTGHGFRAV